MKPADLLPAGLEIEAVLAVVRQLAWEAAAILRAYARGQQPPFGYPAVLSVENDPKGPVSAADLAVNDHLLAGLGRAFPAAAWTLLSEETACQWTEGEPICADWLWILDPLDGTKDFLQGTGEYAVHLALIHQQRPVIGVVVLPELDELWFGLVDGESSKAWCESPSGDRRPVRFSPRRAMAELIPVTSRSHRDDRLDQLLSSLGVADGIARGSVGGKIGAILRGETDLYISLSGRTAPKDWDMAAPEAVLLAAGGSFTHADGRPLLYNTGDSRQAGCLIASHGPAHQDLCQAAAAAMAGIDPLSPL
ncbi:3'(2'),5'-bisphosphate nucleotidase CysQ [Synechococcus sp. CS-1325]|uniref:3'(2'),5'-bisphosphate nucleotidase CysQ family protein n=1 Tax=Synechococcus sp. CS-1325 TaxID=2847979 RepID=UPI000DB48C6A|nr:3'(2'),5'-bisphosphate nucleotidase CysQ [Synechococcus sp. CS-1325]MCT0199461.1 3'(2'),5'-bisphosphate nucleotidase CysQ [Synechococcus sp. CS-1325]PZV03063.1 MAG: 3'(2'),5'-bisphosphate nucleotidase CysQ [Cyanobium sp.]